MSWRLTLRVLGGLLVFLGLALLVPLPSSLLHDDGAAWSFVASSLVTLGVGALVFRFLGGQGSMTHREGFAVVSLGWLAFALFGCLPFLFADVGLGPVDAFFEAISGFTTTGATVLDDLDSVPPSILLWRALSQWIGGMGIIVLGLAILPFLGVGGMQLFEAEVPGPTADRLQPKIEDTAKVLWSVYLALTLAELLLLRVGGLSFHEATCHAFTTMATGGFSTRDGSIGAYSSSFVHGVVTLFMLLAGMNFALHFAALRGRLRGYLRSTELLTYAALFGISTVLVSALIHGDDTSPWLALRDGAFQVASIMTTTGYGTSDYETWPAAAKFLLAVLMVIGGCAGSTAGGIKIVRVLVVLKHAFLQVVRLIHPREVRVLKLDGDVVPRDIVRSVLGFFAVYACLLVAGTLTVSLLGVDLETSLGAVLSSLGNVGPGFGQVGPTETYAALPAAAKLALGGCMLLGRLEFFTVLVLFFPSFWRR